MKRTLLIALFVLSQLASAQDKAEIREFFWGKNDPAAKITEIPQKWKSESAVIIYKNDYYNFHKFGKSVTYISAVRKRIKLLDAAAVKNFSEFSFRERFFTNKGMGSWRRGTTTVGIRIIKPGGKEITIDVDAESKTADQEKIIAIANLEPGDIIDFYRHTVEPFKSFYEVGFDPVEATLGDVYPVMEMKLQFETENDFFVNFSTYNGAPELKETFNKGGERRYELVARDIPKNDFPRWFYPLAEMPCYKFQVFFARSSKFEESAKAFLSEKESVIKKSVSKEDVFAYYADRFKPVAELDDINDFLKGKTFASDAEKVREVYYFTRHKFFTQYFEAFAVKEANLFYPYEFYPNAIFFNSQQEFINYFMSFLKKQKIDYDIIVATPRENGSIQDLLIESNVSTLLRVNTTPPIYLQNFTPFSSTDQFSYDLEDTQAYALQISKGKKIIDAETSKLPATDRNHNLSRTKSLVSLTADMAGLKVSKESSLLGHFKEGEQSRKLAYYDFVTEDYAKYGTLSLLDRVKNKKKREQYGKEMAALVDKIREKQNETFKNAANEEYGFEVADHALTVKSTGRLESKAPFVYQEEFSIKDKLVKKAGDNLVVEIGKMLTSQVEIANNEKVRDNNVYLPFPRTIDNEIIFEIPAGYTVSGLDKLNKNVTNVTGGFTSAATIEGNKLVVRTSKYYVNYFEPKGNWDKMVQFLDAAYQFTQEKILLKKA